MRIQGRRFDTGDAVEVSMESGRVTDVTPSTDGQAELPWIAPGLVDLQINGFHGQEFNDFELTVEKVAQVCTDLDRTGVTQFCATATTHSFEMLANTMALLATACRESPAVAQRTCGIHLEGPYISPQDGPRGAHPLEHCRPPDWDEFRRLQEAAGDQIRILTLSPEYDGSADFIERVVETGVVVAIGHTAADSDQVRAAVDAGATMSTHLGNGAHGQLRRHPNYIWDQLAEDRLTASLIVDGFHLPPAVVQSFVRAKGLARCVLVSDLVGMGGMPPGRYSNTSIGDIEVLDDGRIVVAGQRQYLAGAGLPMTHGIANVMRFSGVSMSDAIEMATTRPAGFVDARCGGFSVGDSADFVLFHAPANGGPIEISATVNQGEQVFVAG